MSRTDPTTGAGLRHRLTYRSRNHFVLCVHPDDGRYTEEYLVTKTELRRFAWALLAELDPVEARAAANEDGEDLADLCRASARPPRRLAVSAVAHRPEPRPYRTTPDSEAHRMLRAYAALGGSGLTAKAREQVALRRPDRAAGVITALVKEGLMRRLNPGGRAIEGHFAMTPLGWAELRRLEDAERRSDAGPATGVAA